MENGEFKGIVRGYQGLGMSGCGMVVVQVRKNTKVPGGMCFRELGELTRTDGRVIKRAIGCVGDHRPCRNIADQLRDRRVIVGVDAMGIFPTIREDEEVK